MKPEESQLLIEILVVMLAIPLAVGVVTGIIAKIKGYKFWIWLFTPPIIGLVMILFLPKTSQKNEPTELRDYQQAKGDFMGGVTAFIYSLIVIGFVMISIIFTFKADPEFKQDNPFLQLKSFLKLK